MMGVRILIKTIRSLVLFLVSFVSLYSTAAQASECVRIYYDEKKYALQLQNLLAHFPNFQTITSPIEKYKPGQLGQCSASFYIGSSSTAQIPEDFLQSLEKREGRFMWIGNSIQQLGNRLSRLSGFHFRGVAGVDLKNLDPEGVPSFFRNVTYKGEIFRKYAEYRDGHLYASTKMSILEKVNEGGTVLAEASQSYSGERIPYAVRNGNFFYVADNPFSDVHPDDRYFVFSDLIFDVLGAPAHREGKKKPAILRLEDVHPCVKVQNLTDIAAIANEFHIPLNIATISIWADPMHASGLCPEAWMPLDHRPKLIETLKEVKRTGGSLIWHGVTHQYESEKNSRNGASGDDFEFWNARDGIPVALDSPSWLLDRLDQGWGALTRAGFAPQVWEAPHYSASPLDYLIFGKVFSWNIGGVKLMPFTSTNRPASVSPELEYANSGLAGSKERKTAFRDFKVSGVLTEKGSQSFPFEIYGDIFGQRVLPENLGYPTSLVGPDGVNAETLLKRAHRNRVIRDIWGSFFFHPYLLDQGEKEKNIAALKRLIQGMIDDGYEFISVDEFIRDKKNILRPEPIDES